MESSTFCLYSNLFLRVTQEILVSNLTWSRSVQTLAKASKTRHTSSSSFFFFFSLAVPDTRRFIQQQTYLPHGQDPERSTHTLATGASCVMTPERLPMPLACGTNHFAWLASGLHVQPVISLDQWQLSGALLGSFLSAGGRYWEARRILSSWDSFVLLFSDNYSRRLLIMMINK